MRGYMGRQLRIKKSPSAQKEVGNERETRERKTVTVRWENIVLLALLIFVTVLLLSNLKEVKELFSMMNHIGNYQSTPNEQFSGVWVFAVIGLVIVAIVKLIVERNRDDGSDD